MRHPPVVVAVTADHVAAVHQCLRHRGNRFDPAALQEERGTCADSGEHLEQPLDPNRVRAVGVLRIERQRHPHCHAEKPYFSTPVMTMPRVNARWKMTNRNTGMSSVIMFPA